LLLLLLLLLLGRRSALLAVRLLLHRERRTGERDEWTSRCSGQRRVRLCCFGVACECVLSMLKWRLVSLNFNQSESVGFVLGECPCSRPLV
jgi:hypothetical protein